MGYTAEQIERWIEELTISKTYIETNRVFKLLIEDKIIAYYSYYLEDTRFLLDNLFVLPDSMRKGIGTHLIKDFLERIKAIDIQRVVLESDPNAVDFYMSFGL